MLGGGASVAKIRINSKKDSMASWEREKLPAGLSEVGKGFADGGPCSLLPPQGPSVGCGAAFPGRGQ